MASVRKIETSHVHPGQVNMQHISTGCCQLDPDCPSVSGNTQHVVHFQCSYVRCAELQTAHCMPMAAPCMPQQVCVVRYF